MTFCIKHTTTELKLVGTARQREKCSECNKEYQRAWWQANKSIQIKRVKANNVRAKQQCRKYILQYLLEHPCTDCGITDPEILEFDHIRDKETGISIMVNNGVSISKLKNEIDKCEVRCANCHRRKTRKQFGYSRY